MGYGFGGDAEDWVLPLTSMVWARWMAFWRSRARHSQSAAMARRAAMAQPRPRKGGFARADFAVDEAEEGGGDEGDEEGGEDERFGDEDKCCHTSGG